MSTTDTPPCADCGQPTLAHDVVAGQYFCGNAGCREYLITRSAPEIAQLRERLTFKPAREVRMLTTEGE